MEALDTDKKTGTVEGSISIAAHDQYGIPLRAKTLSRKEKYRINYDEFRACFDKNGKVLDSKTKNSQIKKLAEHFNKLTQAPGSWDGVVNYLGHSWNGGSVLVAGRDPNDSKRDDVRITGTEFGNFLAQVLPRNNFDEINLVLHACWIDAHKPGSAQFLKDVFDEWYKLRPSRPLSIHATKFQSFANGPGFTMSVRTEGVETRYQFDPVQDKMDKIGDLPGDKAKYPSNYLPGAGNIALLDLESVKQATYLSPKRLYQVDNPVNAYDVPKAPTKSVFQEYTYDKNNQNLITK